MKPLIAVFLLAGLAGLGFASAVALSDKNQTARISSIEREQNLAAASSLPVANVPASSNTNEASPNTQELSETVLPFGSNIGGSFDLIDHFGEPKQLEDYRGKHVMIFFGYANCEAICSAALPLMADTIDLLGDDGQEKLVPLMITVDPENDTPDFMRKKLAEYHPSLIGMTGSDGALADVRTKFQIRVEDVGEDIDGNPIFNHGSFIYLLGPDGKFQTLVPPILEPKQMAKVIKKYLDQG